MSMASKPASAANRLNHKCRHMGDFNWSLVTFSRQEIIQVFSSTHGHRTLPPILTTVELGKGEGKGEVDEGVGEQELENLGRG